MKNDMCLKYTYRTHSGNMGIKNTRDNSLVFLSLSYCLSSSINPEGPGLKSKIKQEMNVGYSGVFMFSAPVH